MQQVPFTTSVPPPPRVVPTGRVMRPRHLQLAAFLAGLAWYFCAKALAASAAGGLAVRFDLGEFRPLLDASFLLFLVCVGLGMLSAVESRRAPLRLTFGLPRRRTARKEWGEGVALGWGVAVVSTLPLLFAGALDVRFWTAPRAWVLALMNLTTLALSTLAVALGVYGYPLQRLVEATGSARATLIMGLLAALYFGFNPDLGGALGFRIAIAFTGALLLCLSWMRTHGLWLLWGLYFAWTAAVGVLFGLPLAGYTDFSSVVESRSAGRLWLTGGQFGPGAGAVTLVALLAAIVVLVRITGDYAWDYTHPPLIPGGFEVDVPPPAAHAASQPAAPPVPTLVQILPTTPGGASSGPRTD